LITEPAKPVRERAYLRLLVELASGAHADNFAAMVDTALGPDAAEHAWAVSPLFERGAGDAEFERFLEVEGTVDAHSLPGVAWDLAHALEDAASGAAVEVVPDLPASFAAPPVVAIALPRDPDLPESAPKHWSIENVNAPAAWSLTRGERVVVGHPDTGYTIHNELTADVLDLTRDRDVIDGDDEARDPLERGTGPEWLFPGHGTRTASVIAGRENGLLVGVAPAATIVPIRTIRTVIRVFAGDVAKAIDYARSIGVHVISMSFGGLPFAGVHAALRRAVNDGIIVLAAAGQYAPFHVVVWPAAYPECLAVAATNARDLAWKHSSHGHEVVISAPGESVWAPTVVDGEVDEVSHGYGTSFSVAHAAGAAALWVAHHGHANLVAQYGGPRVQEAFRHLLGTRGFRRPDRWDTSQMGAGILDVEALVSAELPLPEEVPDAVVAGEPEWIDALAHVLGDVPRERVDAGLRELLRAEDVRRHAAELTYLAAHDPLVRAELIAPTPAAVAVAEPRPSALLQQASHGLAADLAS
jgi:hypothetical protein